MQSPALLRNIELLPDVAADRAERDANAQDGVLLHVNDDGITRPMTQRELRRRGNRAVLESRRKCCLLRRTPKICSASKL